MFTKQLTFWEREREREGKGRKKHDFSGSESGWNKNCFAFLSIATQLDSSSRYSVFFFIFCCLLFCFYILPLSSSVHFIYTFSYIIRETEFQHAPETRPPNQTS